MNFKGCILFPRNGGRFTKWDSRRVSLVRGPGHPGPAGQASRSHRGRRTWGLVRLTRPPGWDPGPRLPVLHSPCWTVLSLYRLLLPRASESLRANPAQSFWLWQWFWCVSRIFPLHGVPHWRLTFSRASWMSENSRTPFTKGTRRLYRA